MWFIISVTVLVLSIVAVLAWFIDTINNYQQHIDKDN